MGRREFVEQLNRMVYPRAVKDLDDSDDLIRIHIIGSYAPPSPPIGYDAKVACVGSCFADEIAKSLTSQGVATAAIGLSERWNTAFTVRAFMAYGMLGTPFPEGFMLEDSQPNPAAFENLRSSTAYIITLGLSVCWFDLTTNQMVLDVKDGHSKQGLVAAFETHTMRQTGVAENVQQIEETIACIRRVNPSAPIIFTLSPIPLFLSKTDEPPICSNTVSKATLRVALDEIMRAGHVGVYYWPSYEIVEWLGKYKRLLWGQDGEDLRHLQPAVVDDIMRRFIQLYFKPREGAVAASLESAPKQSFVRKLDAV